LLFTAGVIAAQATTPVDIWTLTPCTARRGAGDAMRMSSAASPTHPWPLGIPFVSRHIELIVVLIAVASAVPVIASAAAAFIRRRRAGEAVAPGR
jgi:hypothetical protein